MPQLDALVNILGMARRELGGAPVDIVPASESDALPVPAGHLGAIREFILAGGMYGGPRRETICSEEYDVYEERTDRYWLASTAPESSLAPFRPTWVMSAYALAAAARDYGCTEAVDVGSGDGRIAFCADLLGMRAHSIENTKMLADLQGAMPGGAEVYNADASSFDYSALGLRRPAFFVGGLAQMGGDALARAATKEARKIPGAWEGSLWVFPGTDAPKYAPDPLGRAGWGTVMDECGLEHVMTAPLPTAWTLGEPESTPYVFARPKAESKLST